MSKTTDPQLTQWDEERDRVNDLAERARKMKLVVPVLPKETTDNQEGEEEDESPFAGSPPEVPWYALLGNAFCPTGKGGGVDPTCGPGGSRRTTKHGETLYEATRDGSGTWRLANGTPTPDHIQNMKPPIPPTWNEVHVNLDPKATLFAQGTDKKGRVQPRYSDSHNAKAAAGKWGRVSELRKKREGIYKEIEQDAKDPRLKENAECLRVVMKVGIRPGGGSDTGADFESFGATSLQGKHVRVDGEGNVSLAFVAGKSKGKEKVYPISDPKTAKLLARRAKKSGPDGNLFDTSPGSLRNYSKSKDGGGFKTKDHRTALGTETAISEIRRIGSNKRFASMKEYKAAVKEVATKVANTLGNTPNVALKSYISPEVFAGWRPPKGK